MEEPTSQLYESVKETFGKRVVTIPTRKYIYWNNAGWYGIREYFTGDNLQAIQVYQKVAGYQTDKSTAERFAKANNLACPELIMDRPKGEYFHFIV